jgi:hypothetical protein
VTSFQLLFGIFQFNPLQNEQNRSNCFFGNSSRKPHLQSNYNKECKKCYQRRKQSYASTYLAVYVQLESSMLFLNNRIKIILPLYFLTCIILALLQNLINPQNYIGVFPNHIQFLPW